MPFGYYARGWLDSQRIKVATGKIKFDTVDKYAAQVAVYALPEFGPKAIVAITPAHCEQVLAKLVERGMAPRTLKHHWSTLRAVFVYAQRHKAIPSNPLDGVDFSNERSPAPQPAPPPTHQPTSRRHRGEGGGALPGL